MNLRLKLFAFFLALNLLQSPSWSSVNVGPAVERGDGDYVVMLHGIARSSRHMQPLANHLENLGFEVINLDYQSRQSPLEVLAASIAADIDAQVTDGRPVHLVGYSMGGLLALDIALRHRPDNLGRVVQLAAPNHGSEVADLLKDNPLYMSFYGPAGRQLTTERRAAYPESGNIDFDLGIIAGNSTIDPLSSLLIDGADDGKVSVESTRHPAAVDHITVAASHTFFPSNEDVIRQTAHFLRFGKFFRQPEGEAYEQ